MGWLDYIFDSDLRQRRDIEALRKESRRLARRRIRRGANLQAQVNELEESVGALALLCRGLMGLLERKGLWDEQAFREICRQIDAEDGSEDGKAPVPKD
jgi:hypothetical protein